MVYIFRAASANTVSDNRCFRRHFNIYSNGTNVSAKLLRKATRGKVASTIACDCKVLTPPDPKTNNKLRLTRAETRTYFALAWKCKVNSICVAQMSHPCVETGRQATTYANHINTCLPTCVENTWSTSTTELTVTPRILTN